MKSSHLTIKHRPQTFAQVVGQAAVKAVLSRAAAEDRVAPAYLFSGTRGVGKTTLARILAKALNCVTSPAAEPCNECVHCRQITQGNCVDVVEIDAASNRGIDDARRLKEDIGYAPIECRYKVFIIDEAHMLTREAFNALLKTLEEPPGRVTFILATTEPHKFPATIISRCQHYIFKRMGQGELEAHLRDLLGREGVEFEPEAVRLVARRGAGSVRDSMSLLGQVLALGHDRLLAEDVRSILGLAGPEIMLGIIRAVADRDPTAIAEVLSTVLDQGLDLGFFIRELGSAWRTLFLLRQAGDKAMPLLALGEEEAAGWQELAPRFSLAHVHACWQMTLEGQQRVLKSLEPAMALELLLLNLAFLPELLDLENLGQTCTSGQAGPSGPGRPAGPPGGAGPGYRPGAPARSMPAPPRPASQAPQAGAPAPAARPAPAAPPMPPRLADLEDEDDAVAVGAAAAAAPVSGPRDWPGFLRFYEARVKETGRSVQGILRARAEVAGSEIVVSCLGAMHYQHMVAGDSGKALNEYFAEYYGPQARLTVKAPGVAVSGGKELRERKNELKNDPFVRSVAEQFEGHVLDVIPLAGPPTE